MVLVETSDSMPDDAASAVVRLTRDDVEAALLRAAVQGEALVVRSDVAQDRTGQPYLILTLRDTSGNSMPARWWRYPYPVERRPAAGIVCWFRATVEEYAGERQLNVVEGRPVADADLSAYAPETRTSLLELLDQLEEETAGLDAPLQSLVRAVLAGEAFERFCEWPAAQHHHGAVRHGLLAHSLRVATIARELARLYVPAEIAWDTHLVTATALLHDVGKTQTLPRVAGGQLPERAQQVDHVTLGVVLVRLAAATTEPRLEPERLEALTHALLAHHGRREWGAPVEPATLEAWLVHLADLVDARLWRWSGEITADAKAGTS